MNVSRLAVVLLGLAALVACGEQWRVEALSEAVAVEAAAAETVEVTVEVKLTAEDDELDCSRMDWSVTSVLGDGLIVVDAPDFEVLDGEVVLANNLDLDETDAGCEGLHVVELEATEAVNTSLTFQGNVSWKRGSQSGPESALLQVTAKADD